MPPLTLPNCHPLAEVPNGDGTSFVPFDLRTFRPSILIASSHPMPAASNLHRIFRSEMDRLVGVTLPRIFASELAYRLGKQK